MKRAVLLLSCLVATAAADVTPPTGWQSNPDFAAALSPRTDLFGGLPATVHVDVYRAPIAGAVLYVTRAEAKVPAAQRDAAASYELEELRRAFERAGAAAKAQAQSQRVDPATKLAEGTLAWRDDAAGLVTIRRVAIAADANRIVALTGECVLSTELAADVAKACEQSLQTVVPDIALAQRVPLSIVGTAAQPVEVAPAPPVGSAAPSTGPTMQDASKLPPLAPIQVAPPAAPKTESDRRPVILGLGLVVIAVIFYLNRRRRERFEREDARAAARTERPTDDRDETNGESRDNDDDDLHAAADESPPPDAKRDDEKKNDNDTN